uniref:NADH-ubiquinone oxidoreductase chain 2 n=3 Tax=Hapalopsittaca TaxID=303327 RepID=K9KGY6_9PSIT|nr:NADH dehydrogenase subunt 2 [Hapalopsittaca amazonina]AEQ28428.1 NADH dehydrogenase subunit 2 [Hapalopsittaca pyrrhops]
MAPTTKLISTLSILLGTTLTITSNHWATAWAGLEINTLSIIPMISKSHHPRAIEAATKYFLVQATASTLVLFSSTANAQHTGQWDITQLTYPPACALLTIAIAIKLGLTPFHFWFPEVLQGSSLTTAMLLSTVMKLPPTTLLLTSSHSLNPTLLTTMSIMSIALGGWMGLNQTQTRKIMAFSSISHLGWMMTTITYNPKLTLLAFLTYTLMTSSIFLTMNTTNTLKLSTLMIAWTKAPMLSTTLMLTLLSLSGLPPLTGFLPKWLIMQELIKQETTTTATTISTLSLLGLFFYLRLAYCSTITLPPNPSSKTKQWSTKSSTNPLISMLTSLSISLLPLSPMVLTII